MVYSTKNTRIITFIAPVWTYKCSKSFYHSIAFIIEFFKGVFIQYSFKGFIFFHMVSDTKAATSFPSKFLFYTQSP